MRADLFAPVPELGLALEGPGAVRRHFRAEYGAALVSGRPPAAAAQVSVSFGGVDRGAGTPRADGHKSVRWSVALDDPDGDRLAARVGLSGRPRGFAVSLVQGYVVEPLASIAAARAGLVLLPAAALAGDDGAVILLGRSGVGKTSVVARALAADRRAVGDDQIIVGRDGALRPWPRRLRVYPDLRVTAPAAVEKLGAGRRAALRALSVLRAATGGWAAPSFPLRWSALGAEPVGGPLPTRRVVVVHRSDAARELGVEPLSGEAVNAIAGEILHEQRRRFAGLAGPPWGAALEDAERRERQLLAAVFENVACERWSVPEAWPAPRSVAALAQRLGIEG